MSENKTNTEKQLKATTESTVQIIICFALGILLYLAIFDKAGNIGGFIKTLMGSALGKGSVIIPLFLFAWGVILIRLQKNTKFLAYFKGRVGGGILTLILAFQGTLGIFFGGLNPGEVHNAGGLLGYLIYPIFLGSFGPEAGILLLINMYLIGMFLISRKSFYDFLHEIKEIVSSPEKIWDAVPDIFEITKPEVNPEPKPEKKVSNLTAAQIAKDPKFNPNTQTTEYSAEESTDKFLDELRQERIRLERKEAELEARSQALEMAEKLSRKKESEGVSNNESEDEIVFELDDDQSEPDLGGYYGEYSSQDAGDGPSTKSQILDFDKEIDSLKPEDMEKYSKKSKTDSLGEELSNTGSLGTAVSPDQKIKWTLPPFELLKDNKSKNESPENIENNKNIIKKLLDSFGVQVEMDEAVVGPTVTQYTLSLGDGVKFATLNALQKDLTLALAAPSMRMEMPVNGKPLVGIQVPNKQKSEVKLKDILQTEAFITSTDPLPVAIGKDVAGNNLIYSIAKMPHLLVAGSTGSGKSVWINNMLLSLLYRYSPADLQLVLVDMKRVELKLYEKIPHLLSNVITDPARAINALKWAVVEMERRYKLLEDHGKRNISDYNQFAIIKSMKTLPYLVFVIDELGDLMMLAKSEVEPIIVRLTQMSRAVGIHIVLGTQRPDVQVVTGLIKANVPTRICFAVVTQIDSRVVLGSIGGEKLLGRGDGLVLLPGVLQPVRFQGANVDEDEVKKGVEYVKIQGAKNNSFSNYEPGIFDNVSLNVSVPGMNKGKSGSSSAKNGDMVLLYEEAKKLVETYDESSPEFIAESLGVDKRTAKKIVQELQREGVIENEGLF